MRIGRRRWSVAVPSVVALAFFASSFVVPNARSFSSSTAVPHQRLSFSSTSSVDSDASVFVMRSVLRHGGAAHRRFRPRPTDAVVARRPAWFTATTTTTTASSARSDADTRLFSALVEQHDAAPSPKTSDEWEKSSSSLSSEIPDEWRKDERDDGVHGSVNVDVDDDAPIDDPLFYGLRSRPVPDGNWNPHDPLRWTEDFGRRSPDETARLHELARLGEGDEGYVDPALYATTDDLDDVTVVRTVEEALIVLQKLTEAPTDDPNFFHACDTEVMQIDLSNVGPVGNGYVTCASVYSGPGFDYGLGKPPGGTLWIDNLDDAFGVLQVFKPWFEDERHKKVWHNYGFDRHVMWNEGIDCRGLGGDTMHMARLQNTARLLISDDPGRRGYSLEALTHDLLGRRKTPMKEIFGVKRLRKDGTEGSIVDLPPVEVLQRDPKFREQWIRYSTYDAEGTWYLRDALQTKLEGMTWTKDREHNLYKFYQLYLREFAEVLTDMERRGIRVDARNYLANVEQEARKDRDRHVRIFREWAATQIGPDGLALNVASSTQMCTFLFGGSENGKTKVLTETERTFRVPREELDEEALAALEERDRRKREGDPDLEEKDDIELMNLAQLKGLCKQFGLKVSGKKSELQDRVRGHLNFQSHNLNDDNNFSTMSLEDLQQACIARGLPSDTFDRAKLEKELVDDHSFTVELSSMEVSRDQDGYRRVSEALDAAARDNEELSVILEEMRVKAAKVPKHVDVTVRSIGMTPEKFTAGGAPSCTADVLRRLAGEPLPSRENEEPKYGTAYEFFHGGKAGHDACVALYSLTAVGSIDTMIANFLTSLQTLVDEQSRVHCALNINTETGRLSSRRPNLQNQPALEKDTYKIRQAFQSSPGNRLIVADYGQLELRLLASMTHCTSMIEAFQAGGDFHSRTALGMFKYIQEDVEEGGCLLEWDGEAHGGAAPTVPLLKDKYASERRKAKTLNFSIAYGKTAHGLSQDWGVTKKEAEEMLTAWYDSRPEVRDWQKKVKGYAKKHGITRTLMGRYRQLPGALTGNRRENGHAERASINTPIQGGAADVAMMAMIKINRSKTLERLGWILLMQIHDEVILEGPEETSEEAFEEVIRCMEEPWGFGLEKTRVPLLVDGSYTNTNWYDAK